MASSRTFQEMNDELHALQTKLLSSPKKERKMLKKQVVALDEKIREFRAEMSVSVAEPAPLALDDISECTEADFDVGGDSPTNKKEELGLADFTDMTEAEVEELSRELHSLENKLASVPTRVRGARKPKVGELESVAAAKTPSPSRNESPDRKPAATHSWAPPESCIVTHVRSSVTRVELLRSWRPSVTDQKLATRSGGVVTEIQRAIQRMNLLRGQAEEAAWFSKEVKSEEHPDDGSLSDPRAWSMDQVARWLGKCGWKTMEKKALSSQCNGAMLHGMLRSQSPEIWNQLGVVSPGQQRDLVQELCILFHADNLESVSRLQRSARSYLWRAQRKARRQRLATRRAARRELLDMTLEDERLSLRKLNSAIVIQSLHRGNQSRARVAAIQETAMKVRRAEAEWEAKQAAEIRRAKREAEQEAKEAKEQELIDKQAALWNAAMVDEELVGNGADALGQVGEETPDDTGQATAPSEAAVTGVAPEEKSNQDDDGALIAEIEAKNDHLHQLQETMLSIPKKQRGEIKQEIADLDAEIESLSRSRPATPSKQRPGEDEASLGALGAACAIGQLANSVASAEIRDSAMEAVQAAETNAANNLRLVDLETKLKQAEEDRKLLEERAKKAEQEAASLSKETSEEPGFLARLFSSSPEKEVAKEIVKAKTPRVEVPETFAVLIEHLERADKPVSELKLEVVAASGTLKASYDEAYQVLQLIKARGVGKDVQDVAVALHQTLEGPEFDKLVSTVRPNLFQRRIKARLGLE